MSSRVSVIVPVYNSADIVRRAVESALSQRVPVYEVIVVDDASTDADVKELLKGYARVRVHRLPRNTGSPATPRNLGMSIASGDWIAFLDADDEWHPDKIEHQLRRLEQTCAVSCATNAWKNRPNGDKELYFQRLPDRASLLDLLETNLVITSSVIVNRSVLNWCGRFPAGGTGVYEDWAMWLRLAAKMSIELLDQPLVTYSDLPDVSFRSQFESPFRMTQSTLADLRKWSRGSGVILGPRAHGAMLRLSYRTWRSQSGSS